MDRNISGIYFREKRDGKFENICFEDLSEESQDRILDSKNEEFIKNLTKLLAKDLKDICDKFDIIAD